MPKTGSEFAPSLLHLFRFDSLVLMPNHSLKLTGEFAFGKFQSLSSNVMLIFIKHTTLRPEKETEVDFIDKIRELSARIPAGTNT